PASSAAAAAGWEDVVGARVEPPQVRSKRPTWQFDAEVVGDVVEDRQRVGVWALGRGVLRDFERNQVDHVPRDGAAKQEPAAAAGVAPQARNSTSSPGARVWSASTSSGRDTAGGRSST